MPTQPTRTAPWLAAIVAVYLALGTLYALNTPPWQNPDEPAHFNYIRHVAETGALPELRPGDWPDDYLEAIKARRFAPGLSIAPIRYESHQPPLYYLWGSLIYRLAAPWGELGALHALRLFSVLLGALGLLVGYGVVRAALPGRPTIALGAAAFAGTLPMHVAMTAAVNNDVLAELMLGLVALVALRLRWETWTPRRALALGILLGLALLTKLQSYVAVGVAVGALAWEAVGAARQGARPWARALGLGAIMLGTALLLVLPWLWRNLRLYGWGDPLGMVRHGQVVVGQLTTAQLAAQIGPWALIRQGAVTTFHSFWGQFGWMGVPLDGRIYAALALVSALALVGLLIGLPKGVAGIVQHAKADADSEPADDTLTPPSQTPVTLSRDAGEGRRSAARVRATAPTRPAHGGRDVAASACDACRGPALLALWAALTTAAFLWYNLSYVQHQGRYLFPAIIPWGVAFTLGVEGLWMRVVRRWPALPLVAWYGGMALFTAVCLFLWVVPNLRP